MPYQPPSLTAYLCPRTGEDGEHHRRFEELTGSTPSHTLETASWVAHVLVPSATAVSEGGPVSVVVHGEIYDGHPDPAHAVATSWSARGDAVASELAGSYALVVADRERDQLSLVTDRLASRRLFCSGDQDATLVTSALAAHGRDARPDPVGIASYLINGRAYGGRTVLEGVRLLEPASIHRLRADGLTSSRYWEVQFEASGAPEEELRAELSDRMAAAVQRCLFDDPTPFLSLSGGEDASGVGGELRWSAGRRDVECFSFLHGEPRPGCDELVAAEMAGILGYRHRLVQSYDGDLVGFLRENARLGEGNTNVVHEVAAWRTMAGWLAEAERPAVFTGDTVLGWYDVPFRSPQDVLASLCIGTMDHAPHLAQLLPRRSHADMATGLEADCEAIWARCADLDDLHDAADFLNIDQRLPHVILPWREAVAGQYAAMRRPFIDNDVLDLVIALPTAHRRDKRLYSRTVAAKFPGLFAVPRATEQNFRIDLTAEVIRHGVALRDLIDDGSSVVDDVVPPEVAHRLLAAAMQPVRGSRLAPTRRVAHRLVPAPVRSRVRSWLRPSPPERIPPALLVVRLLILRTALPS